MPFPGYEFLPAPLWLVTVLHLLTFTLHLVAMNILVGATVALIWGKFAGSGQTAISSLLEHLPSVMAATITLGVAPLLFLQLVFPRQAYAAAITSGWFWLMIIPVLAVTYYLLYAASMGHKSDRCRSWLLGLSLIGMLYISFVYSSVFSLAENPSLYRSLYAGDQSGWAINPDISDWFFRWLHMLSGAITVGGFVVAWLGNRGDQKMFGFGRRLFFWGIAVASVTGLIYLLTLGEDLLGIMRSPGIWAMTLGIVLAALSVHFVIKKKFGAGAIVTLLAVASMVTTRHYLRLVRLDEFYQPASVPVQPQWSVFVLFAICLVVAVILVWYMLRLYLQRQPLADH